MYLEFYKRYPTVCALTYFVSRKLPHIGAKLYARVLKKSQLLGGGSILLHVNVELRLFGERDKK